MAFSVSASSPLVPSPQELPPSHSKRNAPTPSCLWASAPELPLPRIASPWPLFVESCVSTRHQLRCPSPEDFSAWMRCPLSGAPRHPVHTPHSSIHHLLVCFLSQAVSSPRAWTVLCWLLYPHPLAGARQPADMVTL